MVRNIPQPLSAETHAHQMRVHAVLDSLGQGTSVALTYVKRDGRPGVSVGPIIEFGGAPGLDTGCVIIDTSAAKGRPSTINMHNVISVDGKLIR